MRLNTKIQVLIIILLLINIHCYSQQNVQISLGSYYYQQSPTLKLVFSETDNVTFTRDFTTITGSILLINPINSKFELRYGIGFRGSPLAAVLRFEKEIGGINESIYIVYDYTILNINIPVDISYPANRWFYIFVGIIPMYNIDLTDKKKYYQGGISFLNEKDSKKRIEQLSSHIASFGVIIRSGVGIRYKSIGLELSYDKLLTNALKKEFQFNNNFLPTKLTYSTLLFKVAYTFPWYQNK